MKSDVERNLGSQPIEAIMEELDLKAQDLVRSSEDHITHKMVSRACKGRRLTNKVQLKIRDALNTAAKKSYRKAELFTY